MTAPQSVDIALDIPDYGVSTASSSSSRGAVKTFPLLIQYLAWKSSILQNKLPEMKRIPNESTDTIAQDIKNELIVIF